MEKDGACNATYYWQRSLTTSRMRPPRSCPLPYLCSFLAQSQPPTCSSGRVRIFSCARSANRSPTKLGPLRSREDSHGSLRLRSNPLLDDPFGRKLRSGFLDLVGLPRLAAETASCVALRDGRVVCSRADSRRGVGCLNRQQVAVLQRGRDSNTPRPADTSNHCRPRYFRLSAVTCLDATFSFNFIRSTVGPEVLVEDWSGACLRCSPLRNRRHGSWPHPPSKSS